MWPNGLVVGGSPSVNKDNLVFLYESLYFVLTEVTTVKASQTTWGACFAPAAVSLFPESVISLDKVSGLLTSSVFYFNLQEWAPLDPASLFTPSSSVSWLWSGPALCVWCVTSCRYLTPPLSPRSVQQQTWGVCWYDEHIPGLDFL